MALLNSKEKEGAKSQPSENLWSHYVTMGQLNDVGCLRVERFSHNMKIPGYNLLIYLLMN